MRQAPTTDPQLIYEDALRDQRAHYGAADATVAAVMFHLRENGLAAILDPDCQDRLEVLSADQIAKVIARLSGRKMRDACPAITDQLLDKLGGLR
jgi:hypothetical protein